MIPADHAARQTALDLQRQLCVRAPAGSGKTGLLICRMLAALGSVDQPEQVLAITFTRKAAAEIRDRLFAALDAASGPCPADDFGATLHRLAAAVCARSARLGWDLPQNPQRIRASTIDSLNRDLARQMPVLSGLGGHIQPRDDAGELYRAALLTVLGRIEDPTLDSQERDSLGRVLRLARNRLDDLLAALAPLLAQREQWVRSALDAETAAVEQRARAHLDELIQASLEQVNRALPKPPRQAWLGLLQQLAAQGVAPWQPLQGQAQWPGTSPADLPTWQILASSLLTNSNDWRKPGGLKSTTGFPAGAAMQEAKRVLPEFVHAGETVRAQLALLRLLPAQLPREDLQLASDLLRVLREALLQLTLDFAQHGHCDHTQLALAARQALADPGSPAAARADARLRHILVDEMQDTSAGQIALLEALVRDWQPGDGRSLFLVGDPQQSIYLFRQARVERFHALLQPGAQLGPVTLQPLQLSHNFRSDPALVHWTNATMAQVFMARGSPIPFAPSATTTPDGEPPAGAANLPREGSTAALATPAVQLWSPADPAAEARLALEHLREIRKACPDAHIGVLARNRRHLQPLARLLRESGLPFAGVELEALQDTAVIRDYLSIVRVLHQAEDDVASLRLLRIPGVGLSWAQCDELVALWPDARWAQRLRQPLPAAADPDLRRRLEGLQQALQAAEHNLARFGELPRASRLFFHAVHRPAGLHASERRDVQRFEQFLRSHCPSGMLEDEAAFARGLQKLWADSDADALELMTVHKSKGLEFDHVLLLGLGRSGRGGDEPLLRWHAQYGAGLLAVRPPPSPRGSSPPQLYRWLSEQQKEVEAAERLRLLYVAVTRARHGVHLYLTGRGDHDSLGAPLKHLLPWPEAEPTASPDTGADDHATWLDVRHARLREAPPAAATSVLLAPPRARLPVPSQLGRGSAASAMLDLDTLEANLVGTSVHEALERLTRVGLTDWSAQRDAWLRALQAGLARRGLPAVRRPAALRRIAALLDRALAGAGRYLLQDHRWARSEFAVSGVIDGRITQGIIDRCFVNRAGELWVVDYKTNAAPATEDHAPWHADLMARYAPQLHRYIELLAPLRSERPLRAILYLLDTDTLLDVSHPTPRTVRPPA